MKHIRGFTLIELLTVIFIIGILATLILANFSRAREKTRDSRRKADMSTLKTALDGYYQRNQGYPIDTFNGDETSISATDSSTGKKVWATSSVGGQTPSLWFLQRDGFIQRLPVDPKNQGDLTNQTGFYYGFDPRCSIGSSGQIEAVGTNENVQAKIQNLPQTAYLYVNQFEASQADAANDGGNDPNKYEVFAGGITRQTGNSITCP